MGRSLTRSNQSRAIRRIAEAFEQASRSCESARRDGDRVRARRARGHRALSAFPGSMQCNWAKCVLFSRIDRVAPFLRESPRPAMRSRHSLPILRR